VVSHLISAFNGVFRVETGAFAVIVTAAESTGVDAYDGVGRHVVSSAITGIV
jgi:hypothetical protein